MEWIRWIFGVSMLTGGAGVALQALWSFRKHHSENVRARWEAWNEEREVQAREAAEQEEIELAESNQDQAFEAASLQDAIRYERIPLRQSGRDQHYDLQIWARQIAWLIYGKLIPGVSGRVGSPLNSTMFKARVDEPQKLDRFQWVRIFIDEAVCQSIRNYYNLNLAELNAKLRQEILDVLDDFFIPECHEAYERKLLVNVFERNMKQATCFSADFLPLLPYNDAPLQCDAYLQLGSGHGRVAMPAPDNSRLMFSDQVLGLRQGYFPLLPECSGIVEIGPHAYCHIQTHKQHCAGTLIMGWRDTQEIGVGGVLEVREVKAVKGERFFLRHQVGEDWRDDTLEPRTKTRLATAEEGRQTTCEIWRRFGGEETLLLTLVMRNRRPPLDSLPDCSIFEDAFQTFDNERQVARFLAGQMYFATKRQKNLGDLPSLEDALGRTFFSDPDRGGPIFNRGRRREPLRCRIKVCVSPTRLNQLHEWMGDRDMPSRLAALIMDVIQEDDDYQEAFANVAKNDLEPREGTPGLSVEVGSDAVLGADTVLVRCLPVFVPNRRREIYGRLHFEEWPGARDRSDFSVKEGLTFFTDYPSGMVALHLSRFPVYEVQAPGIFGAIKVHIVEAGTPGARLKIDNHSSATISVDGKSLQRPASHTVEFAGREHPPVNLLLGDRKVSVELYPEPLAQSDEPHFVPEPARLELYGLTLHRRLERTGWETARNFKQLWDNASVHENKELRGISQVTANSFLTVVERGAGLEHHLFTDGASQLTGEMECTLPAGQNTLDKGPLPHLVKFSETQPTNVEVHYHRLDFAQHRIINANILTFDYWDYWIEEIEPLLGEGERLARVELARCKPGATDNRDAHLYLAETVSSEGQRRGWLWHKDSGISAVRTRASKEPLFSGGGQLIGPFNDIDGKLFLVDWEGEQGTPVSFDPEDHEDQVRRYLSDGYFSLAEDAPFNIGGKIGGDSRTYKSPPPQYISATPLHLHYDENGTSSRRCLNFNTREMANFFDKDSFRIAYSGDAQAFVIESVAHRKDIITPKTVFMIIPEGGHAILGSHALSPVKIPAGVNTIVLPGITFKLSQGPVYYA